MRKWCLLALVAAVALPVYAGSDIRLSIGGGQIIVSPDGSVGWTPDRFATAPRVGLQTDGRQAEILVPLPDNPLAFARARLAIEWIGENKPLLENAFQNWLRVAPADPQARTAFLNQHLQEYLATSGFTSATSSEQGYASGAVDLALDGKGSVSPNGCWSMPMCSGCKVYHCGPDRCDCYAIGWTCCVIGFAQLQQN